MIRLQIERFDESKRILAFKEAEGDRYLFIGFGEKEAAEIGRAMRLEPFAADANRAIWMEMIEQRGARLDSVVITDLVDGVFKASVFLTQEGRSFDLPARPADAIAWALLQGASLLGTDHALSNSGVRWSTQSIERLMSGVTPEISSEESGTRLAAFSLRSTPFNDMTRRLIKPIVVLAKIVTGLLLVATVLCALTIYLNDSSLPTAGSTVKIVGSLLVIIFLIRLLAQMLKLQEPNQTVLEIYPVGVHFRQGTQSVLMPWRGFRAAGKLAPIPGAAEGLLFAKRVNLLPGIPLDSFEREWRLGLLGTLVQRYAPWLLGIEPHDLDGGGSIF